MADRKVSEMAHLMRRAGFGATRDELSDLVDQGYEATVDALLNPASDERIPDDLIRRYHPSQSAMMDRGSTAANWLYRMISTKAPLHEKTALFWHGIFATGYPKVMHGKLIADQVKMFRSHGLGSFKTLLVELSRDPAMILWLDNKDNHKDSINENYGRELLELFSMGVGNYTEEDVKECAKAFTGWTIENEEYMAIKANNDSIWPYGRLAGRFEFLNEDHDDGNREFLGNSGHLEGNDIIDIICAHPATSRFISRHLYNFFVADEPQVPAWPHTPPKDPEAINILSNAYFESDYNIGHMLKVLFTSDFFRSEESWYQKVKSPAELVAGVSRLTCEFTSPSRAIEDRNLQMTVMGQELINPPSVEGWHTGSEWLNTGTVVERINFSAEQLGDTSKPGVQTMINNIVLQNSGVTSPEHIVDSCLDQLGGYSVSNLTRSSVVDMASKLGNLSIDNGQTDQTTKDKLGQILAVLASVPEFQRG